MASSGQHYPIRSPVSGSMMASQGATGSFSQAQAPQQTQGSTQGIQHQQSFPANVSSTPQQPPQMMSPTKSVNSVSLCKLGQETNQELVNRMLDVFRQLKNMQDKLPNAPNNTYQDKRLKMEESLRQLSMNFRKLRLIYDKVSELIVDPDNAEEVLVPFKGEVVEEKNTSTDAYKFVSEEHKQIVEQIHQKNVQIKDVVDKIRTVMWEINTMIIMRKT